MGHDDTLTGQCEEARLYAKEVHGRSEGLREAGNQVMERAVEEFKRGNNRELAETLRSIASMLLERAKTVRRNSTLLK